MLLSKDIIAKLLRNQEFIRRVLSVVVDEAHVVSHWGAGFRKKYGELGVIRAFLQRGTPIIAMSATLPDRVRNDVLRKLQFSKEYIRIDVGNDRPNVSLVVRAIHNHMNTYVDLDFVLPTNVTDSSQIKKTFIYADNVEAGIEIEDHLMELLPQNLRDEGVIRPYSAAFSEKYRNRVMNLFRRGIVRILVCTDAAGMVCSATAQNSSV